MRRSRILVVVLMAAVLGALAVAPASAAGNTTSLRRIKINYFSFHPNWMQVAPGTEIRVINGDWATRHEPHTVTASDGSFDTEIVGGRPAEFFAPQTPGRYPYFCEVHPFMHGVLIVTGG
jgi:plastocyanin